jgi:hypothetical protein
VVITGKKGMSHTIQLCFGFACGCERPVRDDISRHFYQTYEAQSPFILIQTTVVVLEDLLCLILVLLFVKDSCVLCVCGGRKKQANKQANKQTKQ